MSAGDLPEVHRRDVDQPDLPLDDAHLPDAAWVAALAGLPKMGPVRLGALLGHRRAPEAWQLVCAGGLHHVETVAARCRGLGEELDRAWSSAARRVDVAALWRRHADEGISVLVPGDPTWPEALVGDPEPPAVLFVRGDPSCFQRPAVAIVGTRRCTPTGRSVAQELGRDLAAAGVCVVSGLALGIDGAAHRGALGGGGAPPAAVVGTGLDRTYPASHAPLAAEIAGIGAVVGEYPLGTPPAAWRFPARNRIVAALASVVVVVESGTHGGSMHTVDAALERDRAVLAVPGSVRNPAAAGTNRLLAAGCAPAVDATDVLVALGLDTSGPAGPGASSRVHAGGSGAPVTVSPDQLVVLEALGWDAATLEQVADRLGEPLGPVALHLTELERLAVVVRGGAWYTRVAQVVS